MNAKKRRRGHGEGSIYQRESDGKWVAVLDLGYVDGTRQRKTVYGKTRKEAQEKLQTLQQQYASGMVVSGKTTVGEWLQRWLDEVITHRAVKTQRTYRVIVRLHIISRIGNIQLVKLTPEHVQRMINGILKDNTAHNARYAVNTLKSALTTAMKRGYVSRNVATLVDLPKVPRYRVTIFTPEQARLFLDTAREMSRYHHLYCVALGLGMRQGELIRLKWCEVNFDRNYLEVNVSKTRAGERHIMLPDIIVETLKKQRQHTRIMQLTAGAAWRNNDLVFPAGHGQHLSDGVLRSDFKRVLRRANLPDIRFHDMRHSCASFLLAQGIQPKVVSEILGHSNISITLNTYTHVLEDVQREAVESVAKMLGS